ncbi:maestro heat-like repeat-containing protein family member 1 isoform X2 [Mytilus californianus]|uniref:maestro heat-like repeat-containing protein family member 1 isoform X2 n=1 Tax=Mytilus californianus TaxID=6549 RepID=UPI0022459781|nr:maestro heat-like repeat-containing protein family member 1 isoform X2 [Mytilus californianus]
MIMPGVDDDAVRNTGGQVDDLAMAMIDAAYDRESDCRDQICDALFDLGKKRPALVLSSSYSYLKKHNKLQTGHRVVLLQCMERIIKETLSELDPPLAVDVIKQAAMELTVSKEVMPEWQTAASGVLVSLGARFCDEVMDEMLQRFQPGILPHFFVIQTIGNLATSNVYGMVPHLTAVLGTMLPMLGMAKHENMRWVFSSAISKFSEAIIDYCANTDKAPDPSVSKERFEQEIGSAFDVLFNSWLHITKEMKLRVAIVEAIGNMCHLMARDKLEEQLPKILQVILGLYKKHPEPIHVTQGLCSVLDAVCIEGNTVLEPNLDTVLGFLFPQIINPPDYKNPQSIKNHNEVLRCLAIIARSFSGKLTGILLSKLESGNEKMKIGMLTVFKHLINAATESMNDKQEVVVSGLKMMLSEQNNKLKKVFAQVVIAMAHHGYLELEGGQQMIEFIIKQSALKNDPPGKRSPDPEYVSNQALRTMCDHVLQLLTTTVEDMEHVLWPYLLELIVPEQYTEAQGVVCKCLSHLATKKRKEQTEDYEIDFETQANIPKPEALIARLMVLAGRPQNGRNRGIHVLTLMQGLVPNLNENLVELWDTVIPKLIQYLEDASKEDSWNQKNWEDLSLKLLSKSLDVVDNEEWIAELGEVFGQQIPMYNNYPEEKNFMYKCLGVITRKSTKKDFVGKHLDLIFGSVKHTDQTEREGCAIAMGFCAASHLDAVLSKLESVAKTELQQKSSGLFSFMKIGFAANKGEKSEVDIERTKATLMLCYGFVALFSPVSLIVSRMEATILRSIQPYFANVKDTSVKQNLIRTLDLIGDALHPDHLKTTYNFSNRGEFITHLQSYMQMESTTSLTNETRALAMNACSTLVKLDPRLSEAEELDLVKTSIDCIYPLPPGGLPVSKKAKEESYDKTLEAEVLMSATFDALHDLLKEILLKDLTPNGLNTIFKQLSKWFLSLEEYERERSLTTLLIVETFLLENMEPSSNNITDFPTECVILAKLVPRCTDPNIKVRQMAMDCVQCTLRIASKIAGNSMDQPDQMIDALCTLKERLEKDDPNVLFSVINDLAKVIAKKLPSGQLIEFLDVLQEGLLDPQSHSSSGACVVLNGILKARGSEVSKQVSSIIGYLHDKLGQIEFDQTRTGTLRSVRTLSSHHLTNVLKALLSYPLPYDSNIVAIWQILSQDPMLTSGFTDQMLDMLQRQLPYEEKQDGDRTTKIATQQPLAVTCALKIIFDVEESEEVIKKNYHRFFSSLLIRIGSSINCKPPKPVVEEKETKPKEKKKSVPPPSSKVPIPSLAAVEAFRSFLQRSKSDDIIEGLDKEDCWEMFEDEERYPESVTILCRYLVESAVGGPYISKIVTSIASSLSSLYDPQRVTVAAFFSELINLKCAGNDDMIEMVMNSLLGRLVDSSHMVRMLCIRGLGNVASNEKQQVQQYSTTVLSAMMAGMDDKEDPEDLITTEAMSGLSKILSEIDESHIRAILINVSLRIRPCFEKDRPAVRAQAFILFGNLSRFGDGPSKAPFLEQIHSNFVSLLLHLNDPDKEVKKACKFSLRLLGPLLESEAINNKFQKYLLEDANLIYGEFMNDLAKCIIQDFPDKVNFYVMGCISFYKSMWPEIKCNAALFTGYLLGNLQHDKQVAISKEHVCAALIILLKDQSASVRAAAAEAMSLLYEY